MGYLNVIEEKIMLMVDEDPQKRVEFKNDPKKFIKDNYRIQLPDDIAIKVVEDTYAEWHFILPPESDDEVGFY